MTYPHDIRFRQRAREAARLRAHRLQRKELDAPPPLVPYPVVPTLAPDPLPEPDGIPTLRYRLAMRNRQRRGVL